MFRQLLSYYLPFDAELGFRLPWVWANARQYAYRHAIACLAMTAISLAADANALPAMALAAHALALVTVFFASLFTMAAIDPRAR